MDPTRGDSRYLNYGMGGIGLSLSDSADLYGNPGGLSGRPPSGGLIQSMGRSGGLLGHGGAGSPVGGGGQCQTMVGNAGSGQSRGVKRSSSDCYDDHRGGSGGTMTSQGLHPGMEGCGGAGGGAGGQQQQNVQDVVDDGFTSLQNKKSPPANGKKTKGRVKIKMEYIDNKLRRYTTFSKRKTGIMKKAYELSTLTGTQVMLLVASETGHVYTFATRKLQPMITSEAGKQLIQTCLNSPDPPTGGSGGDQRMSATGFEETELSYNIADEDSKDDRSPLSSANESDESSDIDSSEQPVNSQSMLAESPGLDHHYSQNLHHQQSQIPSSSTSHLSGMGGVLYPASALANIPQEVLLGLVQSGHLQLHSEDDGSHQFITIPLSMANSTNSSSASGSSSAGGGSGSGGGGGLIASHSGNNKIHIKDLTAKGRSSHSSLTTVTSSATSSSSANGRESPPKEGIRIKKEIIE